MSLLRSKRLYIALAAIALVAIAATARSVFTASNTIPNANIGQGANTISGYTLTGVTYTPDGTNPGNIDSVSFTISPASAGTVEVQLSPGGAWYGCTNSSGSVSCTTTSPQATAAGATALNVVAEQ